MTLNNHILISELAEEYVGGFTKESDTKTFIRGDVAAAYMIGAEKTLRRVCNVIRESCIIGALTSDVTIRLLSAIESVEANQITEYPGELSLIRQLAYETVTEILQTKQGVVEPCMAHIDEIRNSINAKLPGSLRWLCYQGKLNVHLDHNKNPMFTIKLT